MLADIGDQPQLSCSLAICFGRSAMCFCLMIFSSISCPIQCPLFFEGKKSVQIVNQNYVPFNFCYAFDIFHAG